MHLLMGETKSHIITVNNPKFTKVLAELIKEISDKQIAKNGVLNIGVSGGSWIRFLKEGLPQIQTDFSKWRIFFCDERVVPEDSPDSTFGQYKQHLLGAVNLKEEQFVKILQGVSPDAAAADYLRQMALYFPWGSWPRFDLLLLGLGDDGHTCSLFPGHELLEEKSRWVAAITDSPKPPSDRITLTLPVINSARNCIFAVSGKEKADMVKRVVRGKEDLPATRVEPTDGHLFWIADDDAGEFINDLS